MKVCLDFYSPFHRVYDLQRNNTIYRYTIQYVNTLYFRSSKRYIHALCVRVCVCVLEIWAYPSRSVQLSPSPKLLFTSSGIVKTSAHTFLTTNASRIRFDELAVLVVL